MAYNLAITCYNLPFLHFTLRLEQFALHQGIQRFQAPAHLVSWDQTVVAHVAEEARQGVSMRPNL